MNFHEALIATYCENPCQVLPNALWKTLSWLDGWRSSFNIENDVVTQLEAWNENRLMLYWSRSREQLPKLSQKPDFALVHQDYLGLFPVSDFAVCTAYFRLIRKVDEPEQLVHLPQGFSFVNVNVFQEVDAIAAIPVMKWSMVIIFLTLSQSTPRTLRFLRILQRNYPANAGFAYF